MGLKGIWAGIEVLRVLVFPHLLTYVDPQGRETEITKITLTSSGSCIARKGSGEIVAMGTRFDFDYDTLTTPITVSCTAPLTVVREQGRRAYTYAGTLRVQRGKNAQLPAHVQVINDVGLED